MTIKEDLWTDRRIQIIASSSHYLPDQKHCSIVTEVGVHVDVFRETGYGFGEKAPFRAITINGSNDKTKQK